MHATVLEVLAPTTLLVARCTHCTHRQSVLDGQRALRWDAVLRVFDEQQGRAMLLPTAQCGSCRRRGTLAPQMTIALLAAAAKTTVELHVSSDAAVRQVIGGTVHDVCALLAEHCGGAASSSTATLSRSDVDDIVASAVRVFFMSRPFVVYGGAASTSACQEDATGTGGTAAAAAAAATTSKAAAAPAGASRLAPAHGRATRARTRVHAAAAADDDDSVTPRAVSVLQSMMTPHVRRERAQVVYDAIDRITPLTTPATLRDVLRGMLERAAPLPRRRPGAAMRTPTTRVLPPRTPATGASLAAAGAATTTSAARVTTRSARRRSLSESALEPLEPTLHSLDSIDTGYAMARRSVRSSARAARRASSTSSAPAGQRLVPPADFMPLGGDGDSDGAGAAPAADTPARPRPLALFRSPSALCAEPAAAPLAGAPASQLSFGAAQSLGTPPPPQPQPQHALIDKPEVSSGGASVAILSSASSDERAPAAVAQDAPSEQCSFPLGQRSQASDSTARGASDTSVPESPLCEQGGDTATNASRAVARELALGVLARTCAAKPAHLSDSCPDTPCMQTCALPPMPLVCTPEQPADALQSTSDDLGTSQPAAAAAQQRPTNSDAFAAPPAPPSAPSAAGVREHRMSLTSSGGSAPLITPQLSHNGRSVRFADGVADARQPHSSRAIAAPAPPAAGSLSLSMSPASGHDQVQAQAPSDAAPADGDRFSIAKLAEAGEAARSSSSSSSSSSSGARGSGSATSASAAKRVAVSSASPRSARHWCDRLMTQQMPSMHDIDALLADSGTDASDTDDSCGSACADRPLASQEEVLAFETPMSVARMQVAAVCAVTPASAAGSRAAHGADTVPLPSAERAWRDALPEVAAAERHGVRRDLATPMLSAAAQSLVVALPTLAGATPAGAAPRTEPRDSISSSSTPAAARLPALAVDPISTDAAERALGDAGRARALGVRPRNLLVQLALSSDPVSAPRPKLGLGAAGTPAPLRAHARAHEPAAEKPPYPILCQDPSPGAPHPRTAQLAFRAPR